MFYEDYTIGNEDRPGSSEVRRCMGVKILELIDINYTEDRQQKLRSAQWCKQTEIQFPRMCT